jgi:hypothetical protein
MKNRKKLVDLEEICRPDNPTSLLIRRNAFWIS